jgi:protein-tyrosine phosphatase
VHCVLGRDRTGLVLAHQLVRSSALTPAAAIAQVRQVCPNALSAPGWEQMAERVILESTRSPISAAPGSQVQGRSERPGQRG